MQILFKDPSMQREFSQLDQRLLRIVHFMAAVAWVLYRDLLVCTSIYRNDESTHKTTKPYRFIDFAILENGGMEGSEMLRRLVNIAFRYDQFRPEMETIVPLDHGNAPHIHTQVKV